MNSINSVKKFTGFNGVNSSAVLQIAAGSVCISFSGVWVKFTDVAPTISAFYRVLFGTIFLLIAVIKRREIRWEGFGQLFGGFACGFVFALDLFFWHRSILYVGPGLATLLANFQVIFMTAIGVLFLGEKLRLKFVLSIPLAFFGLALIVGIRPDQLEGTYRTGIYFGLTTALCYTGYLMILRKLQSEQKGKSFFYVITQVSFASALFLGGEAVRAGYSFYIPNVKSLLSLVMMGLFSQCIGWILITNGLPRIRASFVGMILLLQPTLAFVWDVIIFGRNTTFLNWAGVVLAVMAIYMGMTGGNSKDKNEG